MDKRKHHGAGIGIERMNQIMQLLLFRSMTIADITDSLGICRRLVSNYLGRLEDMHKVRYTRPETGKQGGKLKVYSLTFGAMPIPSVCPKEPRRRPLKAEKEKRGPKPKPEPKKSQNAANPCVKTVPAQQIGMHRDPFQALFFGQPQRASA